MKFKKLKSYELVIDESFQFSDQKESHYASHGKEFQRPYASSDKYEKDATKLAKTRVAGSEVSNGNIIGYSRADGRNVTFNKVTGEYVVWKENPSDVNDPHVFTYYIATPKYYNNIKEYGSKQNPKAYMAGESPRRK